MQNKNIKQDIYLLTKSILSDIDDLESLETKGLGEIVGGITRAGQAVGRGIRAAKDLPKTLRTMPANAKQRVQGAAQTLGNTARNTARKAYRGITSGVAAEDAVSDSQQNKYKTNLENWQKQQALAKDPNSNLGEIDRKRILSSSAPTAPQARKRTKAEMLAYGLQNKLDNWSQKRRENAASKRAQAIKTQDARLTGGTSTDSSVPSSTPAVDPSAILPRNPNNEGTAFTAPALDKSILVLIHKSIRNIQTGY